MQFTIAGMEDIGELTKIRIAYTKEEQKGMEPQVEEEMRKKLPDYFRRHLGRDFVAFVAKEHDEIVASAFLLLIEKPNSPKFIGGLTGTVLNVYTFPAYRKKGVATHLLHDLIEYAKAHHLDFIELNATKEGYPLYREMGFADYRSEYTDMRLPL